MVGRFLKHYGTGKAGEILDEFASAVVIVAPDDAGSARIAKAAGRCVIAARPLARLEERPALPATSAA